jgi:hypothetical protein
MKKNIFLIISLITGIFGLVLLAPKLKEPAKKQYYSAVNALHYQWEVNRHSISKNVSSITKSLKSKHFGVQDKAFKDLGSAVEKFKP